MKQLFAILLISLMAMVFQTEARPKKTTRELYQFGLKMSPFVSRMNTNVGNHLLPGLATPSSLGLSAGFIFRFEFPTAKNMTLTSGIILSYKTYKIQVRHELLNYKCHYSFTPFEFPLLLGLGTKVNKYTFVKEFLGVSLDYVRVFGFGDKKSSNDKENLDYAFSYQVFYPREFNLKFVSGIAYEVSLPKGKYMDIGFSFHYGLINESWGNINYRLGILKYKSEIVNRGSFLSLEITYFFCQSGGCPKFR